VPQAAEEFDFAPSKAFGLIVLALALACLMYALLVFATAMATPWEIIAAQKSAWITGDSITRFFGPAGLAILAFSMLMGVGTGLNGFYVSTSRLLFAMGRARIIPQTFAKVHPKYGTPYVGIIFTCLVCLLAPWFGRKVLSWIVDMSSLGVTIAYFYTSAVAFKTTKWSGDANDDSVAPVVKFFSLMGILSATTFLGLLLIPGLPSSLASQCWVALGIWIALGLIFYMIRNKDFKQIPKATMDYYILGDAAANLNNQVNVPPTGTGTKISK
jgi:amino acid transporter